MLKALNLSPALVLDAGTQAFLKTPGSADAIITWAPSPLLIAQGRESWAQTDAAVQWILAAGKRCLVAVGSSQFLQASPPYATRLGLVLDTIERYPQCSIIVSNEPSFAGVDASVSAQLIKDAAEHAAGLKPGAGSTHLLGPAEATFWGTPNTLKHLRDFTPPKGVRVDVAMHHYYDLVNGGARQTRLALASLRLLGGWRPNLFLTEGGFTYHTGKLPDWDPANPANPATWCYTSRTADEVTQLRRVRKHYGWCESKSRVAMWANYEYVDSLWSGWASGLIGHDGTPHPLAAVWPGL